MCKFLFACFALTLAVGHAQADDPTATFDVSAQQVTGGGAVVTPSARVDVPLGDGASVYGAAKAPIYVPPSGSPQAVNPSVSIGFSTPLNF